MVRRNDVQNIDCIYSIKTYLMKEALKKEKKKKQKKHGAFLLILLQLRIHFILDIK